MAKMLYLIGHQHTRCQTGNSALTPARYRTGNSITFEQPHDGSLHQSLGVDAGLGSDLRKLRLLPGRQEDFHCPLGYEKHRAGCIGVERQFPGVFSVFASG
jgi:hypothetical protein